MERWSLDRIIPAESVVLVRSAALQVESARRPAISES